MPFSSKYILACTILTVGVHTANAEEKTDSNIFGSQVTLPAPEKSLVPTVHTAKAIGWPEGAKPVAAADLSVNAYATGLDHPRWLYSLPNGDLLVAESNAPPKPDDKGIKAFFQGLVMKNAGAGTKSANRITLLRGIDENGRATEKHVFLQNLNSPFGMALVGNILYIANTDAILAFPYNNGDTQITEAGKKLVDLPAGPLNHHWTKNILASKDGQHLYATIGSNSNVGENGLEKEQGRAQITEIDIATGESRPFATGIRNPNGLAWNPETGALWTAVNERDELGNNLVPDYITSVKRGAFYGWPYSYFGQNIDARVDPQSPEMVAKAIAPDYAVGAHTASLGLTFAEQSKLPDTYSNGVFIGQHGSWNRKPFSGYKVVFIPFKNGMPAGNPQDVLSGFITADEQAMGRPVGVTFDKQGALLVADDVGNAIWRVSRK